MMDQRDAEWNDRLFVCLAMTRIRALIQRRRRSRRVASSMRLACAQYGAGTDRIFDVSVVGFIIGSSIKYGIQNVGVVSMNGKRLVKVCGHVHFGGGMPKVLVVIDAKVFVPSSTCEDHSCYVGNPRVFFLRVKFLFAKSLRKLNSRYYE